MDRKGDGNSRSLEVKLRLRALDLAATLENILLHRSDRSELKSSDQNQFTPPLCNECQTSFQLENPVHFSLQDDQLITNTKSWILTFLMNTLVLKSLEAGLGKWSNHRTKTSQLSLQTLRLPVLTTSQPYGLLTPRKLPQVWLLLEKTQNRRQIGKIYIVCTVVMGLGMEFLHQNHMSVSLDGPSSYLICEVWSSHPPLQGLAEMSPVSMYSTAHNLFSAARTSGSAHFSPAVNTTSLSSSSNSNIMTSTATNSTLLQGSSFDTLSSPYLSPLQDLDVNMDSFHKPIEFAVPRSRVTHLSRV